MSNSLKQMADLSRFGDIHAMLALGEWFRGKLSEPYLELERSWESAPAQNRQRYEGYTQEHKEEVLYARAGITWLIRASVYGNAQAVQLVSKHVHWNELSLIPERFYFPGTEMKIAVSGANLRKAGFLAFSEDQVYAISSIGTDGIFRAETDAGYDGPDSDGFGMEEYYNFYSYDEFFNQVGCLRKRSHRDYQYQRADFSQSCASKRDFYQKQREQYWKSTLRRGTSEKYKWLTSEYCGELIQNHILKYYGDEGKEEYVVPADVEEIGVKAFCGNIHLQSIVVPETVRRIGADAFMSCKSLKQLVFPKQVELLGRGCCCDSRKLETVRFPENLTALPAYMFQFCHSLKNLVLPEALKVIGEYSFSYCDIQEIVLPEGLEEIATGGFENSAIRKIRIPGNVKIGKEAFYTCRELEEVIIAEGIEEIGSKAFQFCRKLKKVKLPHSLKVIGFDAFGYCESLKRMVIPETVEAIRYDALPKGITVYGKVGTEAERYANEYGLKFIHYFPMASFSLSK